MGLHLNGVRFHASLASVLDRLIAVRPIVEGMQKRVHGTFLATQVCDLLDSHHLLGGDRVLPPNPLREAWDELSERWTKMRTEQRRDPAIDTDAEICLFPSGDAVIGLVRSEMPPFTTLMRDLAGEDWTWGRYERPDGVDAAAWDERERSWTMAMSPSWTPAHRCLTYSYDLPYWSPMGAQEVLSYLPSPEARARSVARQAALDEEKASFVGIDGSEAMRRVSAILGNRERIDALAQGYLDRLPVLTVDMLRGTPD